MSTKNVTLKEKVNGVLGDTIFPATTTPNVYDSAKSQALSQTLVNTPDYEALGFAKFSTATAYNTGDKVYKDNGLYRFIADKAAGEWDVAKVEPWSIEQEIEEVDDAIRSLIPAQASADNKLADKEYVNDKVSTDTATFRGTFNLVTDLELTTEATQGQIATVLGTAVSGEDKNDYAFVQIPTSDATPTEIARIDRYKYTGLQWAFEYSLNNSGFNAEQWAAINSGITSSLVAAFGAKYDKPAGGIPASDMNTGTFDAEPTAGSDNLVKSGGVYNEISWLGQKTNERLSYIDGVIDNGTTYKEKFGNTQRTCVFYTIPDINATYKINVKDVILPTGNNLYLAIRSAKTPYVATYLAYIGQGEYFGDTGEIRFKIPESVKADAKYISVIQQDASLELCQFSVDLSYNGGIVEKNDTEIRNSITELKDRVSKIDGILDEGTTYDKKDATQRVCVYYHIPDVDATYKLKLSDVVLSDSTNEIWAAIRSAKTPYSATALGGIGAGFFNDDAEVVFTIPDNIKADAKFIALTQLNASGEASFKVELEYETKAQKTLSDLESEVGKLQGELLPIDKGTTYSEKFGTTQRTCVFYPIPDKTKEYRIILNDIIIPSGNVVRVFVAKAQSPYDTNPTGNVLQLIGEVNLTGEALDKTFTINESVRSDANYIAVCQLSADLSLCSFNSKIYTTGTIYAQIEGAEQDVEKDVIPYNDSVFAKGRTLKIYNPYKEGGNNQYAGQIHCHSWNYEEYNGVMYKVPIAYTVEQIAAMTPEERNAAVSQTNQDFVAAHKTVGYDFMTITNYDEFLDYSEAPNVLPNDFLWIGNGFESNTGGWDNTGQAEDKGAHLGIINTNFCEKFRDWTPKEIVDYCEDKNCIVIYNHPFLSALYSSPDFVKNIKSRLRFIEVYNGLSVHHSELAPGVPFIKSGIMLDEDYDALISQGNFTFCIAASDERILRTDIPDLKWGCIKVFANELSHKSIINALLEGNFYSTSLLDIKINGVIVADGQYKVDVGIEDAVVEFIGKDNTVLSTVTTSAGNTIASYNIIGTEDFVRARIYKLNSESYDANAWHKNKEWIIWTQPIFIAKEIL